MVTELTAASLYCFKLLFTITLLSFVYRVTVLIRGWGGGGGGGAGKSFLKNEAAACKIFRHRAAHLSGFASSKVACVCVGVRVFESTRIYPSNRNRVPEYLFSFCDTNETVIPMETSSTNIALFCVLFTSVTNSRDVSPV